MAGSQNTPFAGNPTWQQLTVQSVDPRGNVAPQDVSILSQTQFDSYMQRITGALAGVSGFAGQQANINGPLSVNDNPITGVTNSNPPAADEALSAGTAQELYGIFRGVVTLINANYTVLATDGTILSNGSYAITLPDATMVGKDIFIVTQWASGSSTVQGVNGQTINGASTQSLPSQYDSILVQSTGTAWVIVAGLGAGGIGAVVTSLNSLTGALSITAGSGISVTPSSPHITIAATGGTGTVTSVAMTGDGTVFNSTVSGSPVTTSGTLAPALLTQSANKVLAGPGSGSAAAPTFRSLVVADIPSLSLAAINLTAQTAALGSTLIYAVPAAAGGMYQVEFYSKVTTPASVSSVLGGTNSFQLIYTDGDDSVTVTSVAGLLYNATSADLSLNTTQAMQNGLLMISAKASTNINFSYDYTSVGTAMAYCLHVRTQKL